MSWPKGISDIKMQELQSCLDASHFNCQIHPTPKSGVFERQKEREREHAHCFVYVLGENEL